MVALQAGKNSAKTGRNKDVGDSETSGDKSIQSTRETVESVVVAFILAFLFRAFVAEAFVIPTGSMAPTLMGAHKDLFCEHCGEQYQASASIEYDSTTGALRQQKTIASTCSNCRGINAYDFRNNSNHTTFSGDRILVSKFDYVLSSPKRWDVFVFKYPLGARMNYIKRLIGMPGETLQISEGDIFIQNGDDTEWSIARKPPHKIQAMKQLVHDTEHQPAELVRQGWPSLWQPLPSQASTAVNDWEVKHSESSWSASLNAGDTSSWLRYYHKFASLEVWEEIDSGLSLAPVDPYASQLITDYLAYNTPYVMDNANQLFDLKVSGISRFFPGPLRGGPRFVPSEDKTGGKNVFEAATSKATIGSRSSSDVNDGLHWVGDLSGRFHVDIESDAGTLLLDLVEFGVHLQCSIDVETGEATLSALDAGTRLPIFAGAESAQASSPIRGSGRYTIELANFDDQLVLWVNGKPVDFQGANQFDLRQYRNGNARRPHWNAEDPLDAAPLGIGGSNLTMTVRSAEVYRDIYYIAVQPGGRFSDYSIDRSSMAEVIPDTVSRAGISRGSEIIAAVYSHPEWWDKTKLFEMRGFEVYVLEEGQYFPMGDNSAASSDARAWHGHNFVEKRFLLGKALLVFWPHTWNSPVPFTPNIQRMGLIR